MNAYQSDVHSQTPLVSPQEYRLTPLLHPRHCFSLNVLGMGEEGALGSDDDDLPVLKRIEADLQNPELVSPEAKHVDLFSEIHLNELKKLEKQLEQVLYVL